MEPGGRLAMVARDIVMCPRYHLLDETSGGFVIAVRKRISPVWRRRRLRLHRSLRELLGSRVQRVRRRNGRVELGTGAGAGGAARMPSRTGEDLTGAGGRRAVLGAVVVASRAADASLEQRMPLFT